MGLWRRLLKKQMLEAIEISSYAPYGKDKENYIMTYVSSGTHGAMKSIISGCCYPFQIQGLQVLVIKK